MAVSSPPITSSTARLFFALWPDAAQRDALARCVEPLRVGLEAQWIRPENYHLTLAFFAAVPLAQRDELIGRAAALPFTPCELVLQRLEYWPRPQLLCLTPAMTPEPLLALVASINGVAQTLGLPVERRPFRAHITLARKLRIPRPDSELAPLLWRAQDYCLVQSAPAPQGSSYRILRRFGGVASTS